MMYNRRQNFSIIRKGTGMDAEKDEDYLHDGTGDGP